MKLYVASSCAHERKNAEVQFNQPLNFFFTPGSSGVISNGIEIPDDLVRKCGGRRESGFAMEAAIWGYLPDFSRPRVDDKTAKDVANKIWKQIKQNRENIDFGPLEEEYNGNRAFPARTGLYNLLASKSRPSNISL